MSNAPTKARSIFVNVHNLHSPPRPSKLRVASRVQQVKLALRRGSADRSSAYHTGARSAARP